MRSDVRDRIERAVDLMSTRMADEDAPPSLDELAGAAAFSKFHFHRVFRIVTGETCAQALARLRLARGTNALQRRERSVTDAAFLAGYGSSQSFAKALKMQTGKTASELRNEPHILARLVERLAHVEMAGGEAGPRLLAIEIARFDPFEIVAVRTEALYPDVAGTFSALASALGGTQGVTAIIGRAHDDLEGGVDGRPVFDCGFRLRAGDAAVPAGAEAMTVAGGEHLRARHIGSYRALPGTVDIIYRMILGRSDLILADRPTVFHYVDDPGETAEASLRTDIHVPICRIASPKEKESK
ncbi:AraC family transcriptional regulator [Pacificimonas sp. WHA3]|uniref:AraC family transcriptional regulator n=1 Tax=Pacificimonas pallii TaxID=2827236 RepID=A0ABS6S9Z0_9SPHN|nr:AraC family transcriptional regulator [Pacificimonas pallii]MBV7255173.1 AraC family transcriptional regulator [Pacificimonas pallii]